MTSYSSTLERRTLSPAAGPVRQRVVIVGAGPTGVMLAIELARRGIEVRVLDKRRLRSPESRAIGIHARTLEVFHHLGIVEEFLELGHRLDGFVFHTRAGATRLRFSRLDSPYPFLLTLSQSETQRILDQRLAGLGVTIDRGVNVLEIDHDPDCAALRVSGPRPQPERTVLADWVVGCDGAHSIVRRSLGLAFDGDDYGQDWLMAEVNIDLALREDRAHVFSYTAAPLPMFPLPAGRWRLFVPQVPNRAVAERDAPDVEEIERLAAQRGPAGMTLSDPSVLAAFRCYRRSTRSMRSGRVLIAGDAAHIHSPAGGQGMNTGLQDAFNLGWKLALVAEGHAPVALLDTYQAERVPIASSVLSLTHRLVRTFTIASRRRRWLRDRVLPALAAVPTAERRYTNRVAQLAHNYRGGPLAPGSTQRKRRSIAPGDRLPSVSGLQLDGKQLSTLDLICSTAHTLLILTGAHAAADVRDGVMARLARWGDMVRAVVITGPAGSYDPQLVCDPHLRAHRRYHALGGQLMLVRPDGYLASRAPLDRPGIADGYLQQLTSSSVKASHR